MSSAMQVDTETAACKYYTIIDGIFRDHEGKVITAKQAKKLRQKQRDEDAARAKGAPQEKAAAPAGSSLGQAVAGDTAGAAATTTAAAAPSESISSAAASDEASDAASDTASNASGPLRKR